MPDISVIIPTYNRVARLKQVMQALEAQDYPMERFEVLVISDGSSDGTDAYLKNMAPAFSLRVFFQPNQGVAAARNTGVQNAKGELVLFLDDDVVPAPQLLREHCCAHQQHGERVVVLGPMLSPPGYTMQPWLAWEQAMLYKQYNAMQAGQYAPTARQFFTGNTSLARDCVLEAGGFDPRFRRAEDVELAYRLAGLGVRFIFHPGAAGYHYPERSYATWSAIPYAYGQYDVTFSLEKGQVWLLPTVWKEFAGRHLLTRLLVWLCLGRPRLGGTCHFLLRQAMQAAHGLGWRAVARFACSSIFNLRYYQGFANALGGREAFFAGLRGNGSGNFPTGA